MNNKVISLVFGTLLLAGIASLLFLAFNDELNRTNVQNVKSEEVKPYRATLSGEYVCLPHKDSSLGTKECAAGIKTETGEYYAIEFNVMSQTYPTLLSGEKFSAAGLVVPIELASTSQWQKYAVEGIFSVTDSVTVWEGSDEGNVCTMDAKMCPDGSYVGRQGPNCEFAACPNDVIEPVEPVACTMDVKMCPDGSYVGRQGPNCEFAACPNDVIEPVEPVACTRDAKICPDGSAVGRQGPNCEFAACPNDVVEPVEPVRCTTDFKMCPDGSYVGRNPNRQGPNGNCEFAPCP